MFSMTHASYLVIQDSPSWPGLIIEISKGICQAGSRIMKAIPIRGPLGLCIMLSPPKSSNIQTCGRGAKGLKEGQGRHTIIYLNIKANPM
jgi:hypothetical protein